MEPPAGVGLLNEQIAEPSSGRHAPLRVTVAAGRAVVREVGAGACAFR